MSHHLFQDSYVKAAAGSLAPATCVLQPRVCSPHLTQGCACITVCVGGGRLGGVAVAFVCTHGSGSAQGGGGAAVGRGC